MRKFCVNYTIHGSATDIVEADSKEALEEKLAAMTDDELPDPDSVDDIDWYIQEMYPTGDGGWSTIPPTP